MKSLKRMTLGVHFLAPTLLALPGCFGTSDWGGGVGCAEATPVEPRCTDWNNYSGYWHRCHWGEPGINWCNPPAGYVTTSGAGSGSASGSTAGSGGSATADAGGVSSTGSAGGDAGSSATADSGSLSDGASVGTGAGGDAGGGGNSGSGESGASGSGTMGSTGSSGDSGAEALSCTVGATCPAGDACVAGTCQPCAGGVCVCLRDDDCPASQVCDHTVGTCTAAPPACTALTTEANCTARADCTPVYGGMSCTNTAGDICQSGEANCTCATYSFAACVARTP
jgi:hypothetical protein